MKIGEVMARNVVWVAPDASFRAVLESLLRADVSGLPVLDGSGALVGIVTEADLASKEAYGGGRRRPLALLADVLSLRDHHWVTKASGKVAADIMTKHVVVCDPDEDARVVARRMLDRGVKRMPVLQFGRVVGMVCRRDLLNVFTEPDEMIGAGVARVLEQFRDDRGDCPIQYVVDGGVVTLTGFARDAAEEHAVVSLVRDIDGVIDVVSRLHDQTRD